MTSDARPAMRIGEIAQRSELSLRTLRHYDEVGLLRPSGRSEGGFRLYTEHDLAELLVIRRMKPLGFSLEEMVQVMASIRVADPGPRPRALRRAEPGPEAGGADDVGAGDDPLDGDPAQARRRLREVLAEARDRRQRLARQLDMADEFIDLLRARLPAD